MSHHSLEDSLEAIDPRILQSIPHRPPMLLIDAIEEMEEDSIVCIKTFREEEYFFRGHFPGRPIVPGVILCECAAQAGAVLLALRGGQSIGNSIPLLTRMNQVRLKQMVRPGDSLNIHVRLQETIQNVYVMTGRLRTLDGALVTSLEFTCAIQHDGPETTEPTV